MTVDQTLPQKIQTTEHKSGSNKTDNILLPQEQKNTHTARRVTFPV
jgi:hypothetical protein